MKNKGFIIFLAALITFFCVYFLSFTFKARSLDNEAEQFAMVEGNVDFKKKQEYMDSLWEKPVFNFIGAEYTLKEVKENELNLGLDLQGGMHVVLEVSPSEIIKALAGRNANKALGDVLTATKLAQKNAQEPFIDLFYIEYKKANPGILLNKLFATSTNKGRVGIKSTDEEVLTLLRDEVDGAVGRSLTILRSRIDKFGVNQPNIQLLKGTNRIQVELPGVDNPARVRKLLQGVAKLEFFEVYKVEEIYSNFIDLNTYLYEKETANDELAKIESTDEEETTSDIDDLLAGEDLETEEMLVEAEDSTSEELALSDDTEEELSLGLDDDSASADGDSSTLASDSAEAQFKASSLFKNLAINQYGMLARVQDTAKVNKALRNSDNLNFLPSDVHFCWDFKSTEGNDGTSIIQLYALKMGRGGKAPLEGDVITNARESLSMDGKGYEISMRMNPQGAKGWKRLTAANVGKQIAVVLDSRVYSAPNVQGEIPNGSSSITGSFSVEEARDLANILKAGSLPAKLRIVEESVVGPSIGQESIDQGLLSMLAGLGLVIVFMMLYYSKGGAVADIALLINIFFIVGILAQFNASLTLPGIAGIVLTIGMSIDANVLIFERIREELAQGMKILPAITRGYDKAFSAILDSNITTFITGFILYYFGSGPVKGFAVTMMIGIACSFFSAVFISRLIIEWLSRKNEGKGLSFETFISKGLLQNVNIDFVSKRKMAYFFSGIVIVVGFATVFIQGGFNLGVDFKGGRSYVVDFKESISIVDVRGSVKDNFENAGTEVKSFGADNRLKITTSYLSEDESKEADEKVEAALMAGLSQFGGAEIQSSSKVGATIADDIRNTSLTSMIVALVCIFAYIVVRFRKWQFGLGAIIALFHDVLMVLGIFSIARLLGVAYEVDQVFIASMLTIIGYSINDTVVVFDRVREYLIDKPSADVRDTFNKSINSTLNRTLMTSLTTLLVVLVLFIFGGEALRGFSFALLIGVVFGTYSSIFIATPVVLDTAMKSLQKGKVKED